MSYIVKSKQKPLYEVNKEKIFVCGYCDEVIKEGKMIKHLKQIHNVGG